MKKHLFLILLSFLCLRVFCIGYNTNFELGAGLSECLFSDQIEQNKNFGNNFGKAGQYFTEFGGVSADIIFNQTMAIEAGIKYKVINLNYITEKKYANDDVRLTFAVVQIPVLFKYSVPLLKTVDVIDSINFAGGLNFSVIAGSQSYTDSITSTAGKFISPFVDVGGSLKVTYSHKTGPGKLYFGLCSDINFISQEYKIGHQTVSLGNIFTFAPVIGYSFSIIEDKNMSKITEKNKRIKDISVE